jgi:flagellar basal body-associated protein FliL
MKIILWVAGIMVALAILSAVALHLISRGHNKNTEARAERAEKIAHDLHSYIFSGGVKK